MPTGPPGPAGAASIKVGGVGEKVSFAGCFLFSKPSLTIVALSSLILTHGSSVEMTVAVAVSDHRVHVARKTGDFPACYFCWHSLLSLAIFLRLFIFLNGFQVSGGCGKKWPRVEAEERAESGGQGKQATWMGSAAGKDDRGWGRP